MLDTANRVVNYTHQNCRSDFPRLGLTSKQRRRIKKKENRAERKRREALVDLQAVAAEASVSDAYDSMTVAGLRALAKDRGLKGYSSLKKADLVSLLREV